MGGLYRAADYATSREAAAAVAPHLSALQIDVLGHIRRGGGVVTDGELEGLECFSRYSYSTVRKRRTELLAMGLIEPSGRIGRFTTWRAVGVPPPAPDPPADEGGQRLLFVRGHPAAE